MSDTQRPEAHCQAISGLLERRGIRNEVLTGDVTNGKRQGIIDRLNQGEAKVLVATGQLMNTRKGGG